MNNQKQIIQQTIQEFAKITAAYLDEDEVQVLVEQWRRYDTPSAAMMQQCILDIIRLHPQLAPFKSKIRHSFWNILATDTNGGNNPQNDRTNNTLSLTDKTLMTSGDSPLLAFYSVFETIIKQLSENEMQMLFSNLQHRVSTERNLRGYSINKVQFLSDELPNLPNDIHALNTLVQLTYQCLCDIIGPSKADDIMFRSAEIAKKQFTNTIVEALF